MQTAPSRIPRDRDRRLLALIGDTCELLELDEFRRELLRALRRVVPADYASLNDVGPDPRSLAAVCDPPLPEWVFETIAPLLHQNPLVQRYERTRDGRAYRFSDVVSAQELHALPLYIEVYAKIGVRHQIAFTLPQTVGRILGIALTREDRDFTNDERDLLDDARPFLIQAYRNSIRYTQLLRGGTSAAAAPDVVELQGLGLTHRQAEILVLVAQGWRDRDVALGLRISERTVHKHLQLCYRRLGVDSRSRAAAIAWATLEAPPDPLADAPGAGGGR